MRVLLAGGAGFIGSHLADRLISEGYFVVCIDNLSLGKMINIEHLLQNEQFVFVQEDLNNFENLSNIFKENQFDAVFHLAANSDIRLSSENPVIEYKSTFMTTYNILECMRLYNVRKLFFSSTSAIYGDRPDISLDENAGPLLPVSYYGGAKLASESFISSYSYMNGFNTLIFRFPNVIGGRLTHGVIYDFIGKLKMNPQSLQILGDGTQSKPYMYVSDLVDGIVLLFNQINSGVNCFNIGVESETNVNRIADFICEKMGLSNVEYVYTGGKIGWKGDVPRFQYNLKKIHSYGWKAKYSSDEAVKKTLTEVLT